jgi:hypothetical protein
MPSSLQLNLPGFPPPTGVMLPNNPMSPNPVGFTVDPTTGAANPANSNGVDVTRALLNNLGIELVWFPMVPYVTPNAQTTKNFTSLSVTFKAGSPVATCSGSISGTTLTVTGCSSGALAV